MKNIYDYTHVKSVSCFQHNKTTQVDNTMALTIDTSYRNRTEPPLFLQYQTEVNPQPAFIALDLDDGEVRAGVNPESNGTTARNWRGVERRYAISCYVSVQDLDNLFADDDVLALLERIYAGSSVVLDDQSRQVGRLTEDAIDAEFDLEQILERVEPSLSVCDAADYLQKLEPADLALDDDTLDAVIRQQASAEGIILRGLAERISALRSAAE